MVSFYDFFKAKIRELCLSQLRLFSEEEEKMLDPLSFFETSCKMMMLAYPGTLEQPEQPKETKDVILIQDLELSVRAINCLLRAGYRTLDDIIGSSIIDLMKIRNMGKKSLKEIKEVCKEHGYEIPEVRY